VVGCAKFVARAATSPVLVRIELNAAASAYRLSGLFWKSPERVFGCLFTFARSIGAVLQFEQTTPISLEALPPCLPLI
jgi:hypothetical protein